MQDQALTALERRRQPTSAVPAGAVGREIRNSAAGCFDRERHVDPALERNFTGFVERARCIQREFPFSTQVEPLTAP
jgi:hypothetical protein